MAREKITAETEITTSELAAICGVSIRRIQQLVQDGKIETVRKGKFAVARAVAQFIAIKLRKEEEEAPMKEAMRKKAVEEARLKEAKATVAALEARELEGEMHRAEDVKAVVGELVYTIRSSLGALPGRVALDAFAAESPEELSNVVRREVHKIERELAAHEYDPRVYEQMVRERREWKDREGRGDEDEEEDEDE